MKTNIIGILNLSWLHSINRSSHMRKPSFSKTVFVQSHSNISSHRAPSNGVKLGTVWEAMAMRIHVPSGYLLEMLTYIKSHLKIAIVGMEPHGTLNPTRFSSLRFSWLKNTWWSMSERPPAASKQYLTNIFECVECPEKIVSVRKMKHSLNGKKIIFSILIFIYSYFLTILKKFNDLFLFF